MDQSADGRQTQAKRPSSLALNGAATADERTAIAVQDGKTEKPISVFSADEKKRTEQDEEEDDDEDEDEDDTRCGLGSWRPAWLQRLASKKTFVLLHGLIGLHMLTAGSYSVATISTLEKRFKIPSRTSGVISCAWDIGSLCSLLAIGYLGRGGHKPRYVALGTLLAAVSCLGRLAPHLLFGPGQDALELTLEHGGGGGGASYNLSGEGGSSRALCGRDAPPDEDDCSDGGSLGAPALILFFCWFTMGVGTASYFTVGITFIDDNTRKNKAPVALAASQVIRMVGPTIGFAYASYSLSQYVDPSLHPVIDKNDPRWIGAWWMGWGPLALSGVLLALLMLLFPPQLPRAALRRRAEQKLKLQLTGATAGTANRRPSARQRSLRDFRTAFARLLRNKVLIFNTCSGVCFMFGLIGYWTFMPKYMETQYRQSAATASLISGSVGLIFTGLGIASSALLIARFKPRARLLAGWSVLVEIVDVLGHFSWAFLSCGEQDLHGGWSADSGPWNLTSECNAGCGCGPEVKYAPVCWLNGSTTFYSACHAGCSDSYSFANGTSGFVNCSCAAGASVADGPCQRDCGYNFTLFIVTQCIMRFLGSSGKAGNTLIQFRCVDEKDKSLALAFGEFLMCAIAFIPGPVIYGMLLDSACLVWGQMCGQRGNCWLYDGQALRYRLNFTAAGLLFCGMTLDIAVWYYCKGLQIYDNDEKESSDAQIKDNKRLDDGEKPFLDQRQPS